MNPLVKIGRYEIFIGNVLASVQAQDESGALLPEWDVYLVGGLRFRLNAAEKAQLDSERELHDAVLHCYGMIIGQQRAQRPN